MLQSKKVRIYKMGHRFALENISRQCVWVLGFASPAAIAGSALCSSAAVAYLRVYDTVEMCDVDRHCNTFKMSLHR